jgi:hypothetical protein
MLVRATALAAALLLCLAIAGCGGGGSDDTEQVSDVVKSFVDAGNHRDAGAACALLAKQQLAAVRKVGGGGSCASVVGGLLTRAQGNTSVKVDQVRVQGDRATADVTVRQGNGPPRSQSLLLVREDGEWRLASGF